MRKKGEIQGKRRLERAREKYIYNKRWTVKMRER